MKPDYLLLYVEKPLMSKYRLYFFLGLGYLTQDVIFLVPSISGSSFHYSIIEVLRCGASWIFSGNRRRGGHTKKGHGNSFVIG